MERCKKPNSKLLDALNPLLQVAQHHKTRSYVDHAFTLDLSNYHLHRVVVLPDWVHYKINQVLQYLSREIIVL